MSARKFFMVSLLALSVAGASGLLAEGRREPSATLASRLGRDVEMRVRPFAGTPAQIEGSRLTAAVAGRNSAFETARTFLRENRDLLLLSDPDAELELRQSTTDELDRTHLRFGQRYRGLRVWPAELVVHLDTDGSVDLMNGAFVPTPEGLATAPALDGEAATDRAREAVPGGAGATAAAAEPELVVYAPGDSASRLAWKVELAPSVAARWLVVVDAEDGAVLTAFDQVADGHVHASGVDLAGVRRQVGAWTQGGSFYLVDTTKPMFDPASADPIDPRKSRGAIFVFDANGGTAVNHVRSARPRVWKPAAAVSAAWSLSRVYDHFRARHGRDSIDGKGGNVIAVVRDGAKPYNASWNGLYLAFGGGRSFPRSLEIVAHEYSHGITDHTADLLYVEQSGALNEAFSDILGIAVEAAVEGRPDWVIGEGLGDPRLMRSLKDPAAHGQPATMAGYVQTRYDNGGVHTNSGIVAHAFYLLAEGLPGGGIGLADAERIFYRALTVHLVAASRFADARLACVRAAKELFGEGSAQVGATERAFDAVGIRPDEGGSAGSGVG